MKRTTLVYALISLVPAAGCEAVNEVPLRVLLPENPSDLEAADNLTLLLNPGGEFITQAADDALDKPARQAWSLALDALALRAKLAGDVALAKSARHTSLAIMGGFYGSEVPFVRVWVERGLRLMVESARAMQGPGPVGPRIAAARAALEDPG